MSELKTQIFNNLGGLEADSPTKRYQSHVEKHPSTMGIFFFSFVIARLLQSAAKGYRSILLLYAIPGFEDRDLSFPILIRRIQILQFQEGWRVNKPYLLPHLLQEIHYLPANM